MVDTVVNVVEKRAPGPRSRLHGPAAAGPGAREPAPGGHPGARRPDLKWNGAIDGRREQHDRKRAAILDEAARLFDERGYYETSLADIAAALNVTKPTLYYYVTNKEDIVRQIVARAIAAVDACAAQARASGTSGLDRLRHFVADYVAMMNTDAGRCLLTLRRVPVSDKARKDSAIGYRRIDAIGRDLIAEGIDDGSIAPCDVRIASFALYGAMNWTPNWFHSGAALSAREAGDAIFAVFAAGLARSPAPKSSKRSRS